MRGGGPASGGVAELNYCFQPKRSVGYQRTISPSAPLSSFVIAITQRQVFECSSHSGSLATECSSAFAAAGTSPDVRPES